VPTAGAIVYVHNKSYLVTEENNGILLTPGTETNIAVDRTFVYKQPHPYSDCVDSNKVKSKLDSLANSDYDQLSLVDKTIKLLKVYTQQSCQQLCFQDYLIKTYGCFDDTLPHYNLNIQQSCSRYFQSIKENLALFRKDFYVNYANDNCNQKCPVECEYVFYDTTISSSQYPSYSYFDVMMFSNKRNQLAGASTYDSVRSSVLSFNVFYKNDLINRITQTPSTEFEIFICNFGGTVGESI
jgi:hypothetical protein